MKKSVFCLILIILAIQIASASMVGISPAYVHINYEPGLKTHVNFRFSGEAGQEMEILLEGDFAEYAALSKETTVGSDAVSVYLDLPWYMDVPGTHKLQVILRELVDEGAEGVKIRGEVRGNIYIHVPYPGKYIETSFKAENARYGEYNNFELTIDNKGKDEVNTNAYIMIYDSKNNFVERLDLGENFLKSTESITLYGKMDTIGKKAGTYKAIAYVDYSGSQVKKEAEFKIGDLFVEITGYSDGFIRGKINRFDVEIESYWNDPIKDVYARITISNYDILFKTPTADVDSFGKAILSGYFDPTPISEEEFFGSINVIYGGKENLQVFMFKMKKDTDYLLEGLIISASVLFLILVLLFLWHWIYSKDLKNKKTSRKNEKENRKK